MTHYRKSLVVDAPPAALFEALTTQAGLRGWWNAGCEGSFQPGGVFDLHFGRNHKRMRVEKSEPHEVEWLCRYSQMFVGSETPLEEWTGTRMIFRIAPLAGGRTQLELEHIGLTPALVCFPLCNEGWDYYLGSLAQYAATGRGTPFVSPSLETAA